MTAALQMRQDFVKAEEPWITVPFTVIGPTHIQMIMNSAFGLPGLLRQVDDITASAASEDVAVVTIILDQLLDLIDRLATLEGKARKDEGVLEWLQVISNPDALAPLTFPSITIANLFVLIWTFRLLALDSLQHLFTKVPVLLSGPPLYAALAENNRETDRLATLILRSIEYLVSDRFRLFGASSAAMPLQIAAAYYLGSTGENEELEFWYVRVRDLIRIQGFEGLKAIFRQDKRGYTQW